MRRRDMLALGGAALGFAALTGAGRALWPAPKLTFEPVSSPAGYRRLAGQSSGGAPGFTAGIGTSRLPPAPQPSASQLCEIAFGGLPTGSGSLVIASFSDFFCPYCRVLDEEIRALAAGDGRITIVPHEVPLLGRASQMAARGALAATRQGAYDAFYKRLIRTTFVPNVAYLESLAREEGLDLDQFTADLTSAETDATLAASAAAFRAFGFVGTPGLAVGRTLVNGVIGSADLAALAQVEIDEGPPPGCAS